MQDRASLTVQLEESSVIQVEPGTSCLLQIAPSHPVPYESLFFGMNRLLTVNGMRSVTTHRSIVTSTTGTAATKKSRHLLAAIGISARDTRTHVIQ